MNLSTINLLNKNDEYKLLPSLDVIYIMKPIHQPVAMFVSHSCDIANFYAPWWITSELY